MKALIIILFFCNALSAQVQRQDSLKLEVDTTAGFILYWDGYGLEEYDGYLIIDYEMKGKNRIYKGQGYLIKRNKKLYRVWNDYVLKFIPK